MDGPQAVESEQQDNPLRQKFRDYLVPSVARKAYFEVELSQELVDDGNRKIFIEEWLRTIQNASSLTELRSVTGLAYAPHQQPALSTHLRNIIFQSKPELKNKMRYSETAYNPEYDGIRRSTGEKLKSLGLTNSGIKGENSSSIEYIFSILHPNSKEEHVYTADRTETKGKFIFKRKVTVPVEEHYETHRPFEQLMNELLQYDQLQSTTSAPKV